MYKLPKWLQSPYSKIVEEAKEDWDKLIKELIDSGSLAKVRKGEKESNITLSSGEKLRGHRLAWRK